MADSFIIIDLVDLRTEVLVSNLQGNRRAKEVEGGFPGLRV
jgi:hypothetical protein